MLTYNTYSQQFTIQRVAEEPQVNITDEEDINNDEDGNDNNNGDNDTSTPSTPIARKRKSGRPTLAQFTPRSSNRAHEASKLFRVKFATTNPFAVRSDAIDLAWEAYAEARPPLASTLR